MYCTLGDGWLNFPSHFFLAFHMTCSTCYSQERTTPHPPTKHVHKTDENSLLNTQVAIFSSFSLEVKVPLLCLRSPHHNRISILIRPEAQLFADKLQLVRAPSEDSFRRARSSSRGARQDAALHNRSAAQPDVLADLGEAVSSLREAAAARQAKQLPQHRETADRPSVGGFSTVGLLQQAHVEERLGPTLASIASASKVTTKPLDPAPLPKTTPFLAGLQSAWYTRVLKLNSISITAPCLVSIWVEKQQRSSPLLIRKIIKTLDKA